jgi:hypothetical protein
MTSDHLAALESKLRRAGHPEATVTAVDCDGFALCRVDGLELEPRHIATLASALRLMGYSNDKLYAALGALAGYAR